MDELTRCFEGLDVDESALEVDDDRLKKSLRKKRRFEVIRERRQHKRREEHRRRRQVLRTADPQAIECRAIDVCIDLSFGDLMSAKELGKLVRQLGRVWGLQKRYAGLSTTLLDPSDELLAECRRVVSGFDDFKWRVTYGELQENYPEQRIAFLSPDSHHPPLLSLEAGTVYVIGGLVDESGKGSRTTDKATSVDCECYRLPIPEFMRRTGKGTFNIMLTINQVVEILCKLAQSADWKFALKDTVPKRTGYAVESV